MSLFNPSAGVVMLAIASGEKFARQRLLHRGVAEHAALARAGHRDAHAARSLRDVHADDRITRRGIAELLIGALLRHRELDGGDQLALFQRRREHALEEVVRLDRTLVGLDRRPQRQRGGRIVGGRIVVGDADRRSCRDAAPPRRRYARQVPPATESSPSTRHFRDRAVRRHAADGRRCCRTR